MKKILSIILTLLMVISVLCVTAGAEDTFYEIVYGETVDVTVPSSFETEDYTFVKFVPESDGRFICKVFADDPFYAGCELYDEELQLLDTESSYGDDWDYVAATASFIAGNTYYFGLFNYAEEDLTFTLSLECAHVFTDGVCETCSFTCDHTQVTGMGICLCGEKFLGTELEPGVTYIHDTAEYNNNAHWYRFTPEETGTYSIRTRNAEYSMCYLYNADGEYLGCYDEYPDVEKISYKDCLMIYKLDADQTYYYEVSAASEDIVFEVELNKSTHKTITGKVHDVDYIFETDSTCTEHGYSDSIYCPDCDRYLWGHEEKELEEHWDYEDDGICDDCGATIVYDEDNDDENVSTDEDGIMGLIAKVIDMFKNIWEFILNLFSGIIA